VLTQTAAEGGSAKEFAVAWYREGTNRSCSQVYA
jgi:hypothetical protein